MYVSRLVLHDFRSYAAADLVLTAGSTAIVGRNGQGKTNLVEAIDYLSRMSSHRVATDAPLVRAGRDQAVIRADVVREGRTATLEVEITPGKANRARVNRSPLARSRDLIGLVRTVIFAPDDLILAKGDPGDRRRFLDDLLVLRLPRLAGVRADYDRVIKQRNSLLKTIGAARRGGAADAALATLEVWDRQLADIGGELVAERVGLVEDLQPHVRQAYAAVAGAAGRGVVDMSYRCGVELPPRPHPGEVAEALLAAVTARRREEIDRGVSLVGPHRDDLALTLSDGELTLPVKGYASHGEAWSVVVALRVGSYRLLRADGDDPILILDDVFAELDTARRDRLADLVADAEQVLVTAAVDADVPAAIAGSRCRVADGQVSTDAD